MVPRSGSEEDSPIGVRHRESGIGNGAHPTALLTISREEDTTLLLSKSSGVGQVAALHAEPLVRSLDNTPANPVASNITIGA